MKINIQPTVNMLQILRHVEYKAWYALAEYVDNSVQSFTDHKRKLTGPLRVEIEFDRYDKRIVIRDNAGGIKRDDLERALRAADVPPDRSGLNEFGMGMKSASCWFSKDWTIRTKYLKEKIERSVRFDLDDIATSGISRLQVNEKSSSTSHSYTVIELNDVKDIPKGKTVAKIRDHLRDIYRLHIRDNSLILVVNGEELACEEITFLQAEPYTKKNKPEEGRRKREWVKDFIFELDDGRVITGRAGLLSKGDTKRAGLVLFRRKRAIMGTGEEPYRPSTIFGSGNSFVSQRLWGEINLEDFEVTHTKAAIKWEGAENEFLDKLRRELNKKPCALIQQANNYRAKKGSDLGKGAKKVIAKSMNNLESSAKNVGSDLAKVSSSASVKDQPKSLPKKPQHVVAEKDFEISLPGKKEIWNVKVELSDETKDNHWIQFASTETGNNRRVHIRLLLNNPFMQNIVVMHDQDSFEPVLRLAAGLGLAESLARKNNHKSDHGSIRRTLGKILSGSLATYEEDTNV